MADLDLNRRTKIVATIGPATESSERIRELIQAGATTFRLNFSHGDHSEHAARMATIRQVAHEMGVHIGILQDLQGPKIRWVVLKKDPSPLQKVITSLSPRRSALQPDRGDGHLRQTGRGGFRWQPHSFG